MKNFDLIDRYFENILTPKEQLQLSTLLEEDPEFKKEFEFQKDLKLAIAASQREDLRATLQQLEKKAGSKRLLPLPRKWLVAASFVLLTALGFWSVQNRFFPSNEALYREHFEPLRNKVMPITRGSYVQTIAYRAFAAYESAEYHKAISLFSSVKDPKQDHILFYKAMCYLSLDKNEEAIDILLPLATNNRSEGAAGDYSEEARWYLALAYLHQGEEQKAVSQFSLIAEKGEGVFKNEEAKEILRYLD